MKKNIKPPLKPLKEALKGVLYIKIYFLLLSNYTIINNE